MGRGKKAQDAREALFKRLYGVKPVLLNPRAWPAGFGLSANLRLACKSRTMLCIVLFLSGFVQKLRFLNNTISFYDGTDNITVYCTQDRDQALYGRISWLYSDMWKSCGKQGGQR
jgi:hypothetical protein